MVNLDFKILFDHIPESLIVLSPGDTVLFFNQKAADGKPSFGLGAQYIDLIPGPHKDTVQRALDSARQTQSLQMVELECPQDDGRNQFYEIVYNPVINSQQILQFICVYSREKTSEKIFERRSIQMLHQYANLIENANAIIFSVDSRHYITDWNRESVRVTLYEKDDVFTKKIEQFVEKEQQQSFSDVIEDVINGVAAGNVELQLRKKDGVPVTVLLNATARLNAAGAVVGVLFVGQDVTELWEYRKSLEEQIEDRTKKLRMALEKEKELVDLKNRFVSMASHEFRMPLSTINSSVNFVRNNEALREEDVEKLRVIETQINHMRSMIDDVLTIGKVEASKLKATKHNVDLVSFLRNVIAEVKAQQMERSVIFKTPASPIPIQSDEKLLRNIFINLLTNAIKFSPVTSSVEIVIAQTQTHVEVRIIDHGIGIKPDDIEKVFTPFNRGSNTGTIKGTGLGLSIVKRAAETLGGSIHADSTVGIGTTMTVSLPLEINEQ